MSRSIINLSLSFSVAISDLVNQTDCRTFGYLWFRSPLVWESTLAVVDFKLLL